MIHSEVVKTKRVKLLTELKEKAKAKGITQQAIGTGAEMRANNCNRVFQGRYSPYLDTFIAMTDAAGYEIALVEKK